MATTDAKVLGLIARIDKEKATIKKIDKPQFHTNMLYTPAQGNLNQAVNLQTVDDISTLVGIAGQLITQATSYDQAIDVLELESPPKFTWNGFSLNNWIDDIKLRIAKIQIKTRQSRLAELESALDKIISPELRTEMELERIMNALGGEEESAKVPK